MPNFYNLTADLGDLVGGDAIAATARGYVQTNLKSEALIDTGTGGQIRLGDWPVTINPDGTLLVEGLVGSDSTDLNIEAGTLQYQLTVQYRDPARNGREADRTYRSGWFFLNAATDVATVAKAVTPTVAATGADIIAAATVEADRAEAAAELATAPTDTQVSTLVGDEASATSAALSATYGAPVPVGRELDIYSDWTAPATAAAVYTQADSLLMPGSTKADLGLCSDGVNRVYSYTAGAGPTRVVLVGGTHGAEFLSVGHVLRWMEQFISDPTMRTMREQFTVTCVPLLSPYGYNTPSRTNANAVDPNRNYAFFWDKYVSAGPEDAKGTAAFSEAETQIMRDLITAQNPQIVIDTHNLSAGAHMAYAFPSGLVHANRGVIRSAVARTKRRFPTVDFIPEIGTIYTGAPTLAQWANWKMRWQNKQHDAIAVTVETSAQLFDNTTSYAGAESVRMFGTFVNELLALWHNAALPEPAFPLFWLAQRTTWDDTLDVSAGGTKLEQAENGVLTFNELWPRGTSPSNVGYVDVIAPAPGVLSIEADGYIRTGGSATAGVEERVQIAILVDGAFTESGATYVMMPADMASPEGRVNWAVSHRIVVTEDSGQPDAATMYRISLKFTHQDWPGATHLIRATRLRVMFNPQGKDTVNAMPFIQ